MSLTPKQRAIYMTEAGFSEKAIAGILGIDLTAVHALMFEAEPDVELPGGAVELPVFQTSVDLSYDEMVTLPSESIEIVPDPGESKLLAPLCAILQMNEAFGAWNNIDAPATMRLGTSGGAVVRLSLLTQADSQFGQLFRANGGAVLGIPQGTANYITSSTYAQMALASALAGALVLRVFSQDPDFVPTDVGGYPDAVLRVTVVYAIVDLTP